MEINPLNSISPIDGRYRNQTEELSAYFSEASLMRYRLIVEVEYYQSRCKSTGIFFERETCRVWLW